MADEKISEMTAADAITGAEIVPVVQGGGNVRTTIANMAAYGNALVTLSSLGASANGITLVGHTFAQMRADLDLEIGTDVQAYDADLTTWAGITPASGIATFLATPSSANLAAAITDENGSGKLIFSAGTLDIASGKTLTVSNSFTVTATDGSTIAFGAGGTVVYTSRTISASGLATGGGDLSANRTITVTAASAAEAQAMSATDRALTPANLADVGVWRTLSHSAVAVTRNSVNGAGDATETAQATITVPGNSLGANGAIRVRISCSHTNSANVKTWRIRFGGIAGNVPYSVAATSSASLHTMIFIFNRNATNSQHSAHNSAVAQTFSQSTGAFSSFSRDTTADQDIVISNFWAGATASESMTLESVTVEVLKRT